MITAYSVYGDSSRTSIFPPAPASHLASNARKCQVPAGAAVLAGVAALLAGGAEALRRAFASTAGRFASGKNK